jgi:hypothetical protein
MLRYVIEILRESLVVFLYITIFLKFYFVMIVHLYLYL